MISDDAELFLMLNTLVLSIMGKLYLLILVKDTIDRLCSWPMYMRGSLITYMHNAFGK